MRISLVFAVALCYAAMIGCNRRQSAAKESVLQAVNGKTIMLASNDCAVLRLNDGYAVVTILTTDYTAHFKVIASRSGDFARNTELVAEGSTSRLTNVPVKNTRVWFGDGSATETSIKLDWRDHTTAVAVLRGVPLDQIDIQKVNFTTNAQIDPNDLLRAVGKKP